MGFVSDVANYYDLIHFSPKISSDILGFIKNDIGLLEKENFEQYWSEFENKSREFNLKDFYEKFLVQSISFSLDYSGTMSISSSNINNLSFTNR